LKIKVRNYKEVCPRNESRNKLIRKLQEEETIFISAFKAENFHQIRNDFRRMF
jgi:hypothetical protein